jgi:hypothetical protein
MIRTCALTIACVLSACTACNDGELRCPIAREGIARCGGFPDSYPLDGGTPCNVLTQAGCVAGEKCTWLVDALMPQYVGHIGCAPDGTANVGDACMYGAPGATGYDACKKGLVCSAYRGGSGVCKQICDQQGGLPFCDPRHVCVSYPDLFDTGDTTLPAGGICEPACDPLADNDFDGSGSTSAKTGSACGSDASIGCYGYPSFGWPPATAWACMRDINESEAQPIGLRHRVQCNELDGCADAGPTIYVNGCNQGYLPLLRESATVSTAICVALCKPMNCYAGNCGPNDENRLGEAPHRCTNPDRVGSFDTSVNGEHCRYIWSFELDDQDNFLRSPTSDTLGFCFDHSKYLYDSNGDNMGDTPSPPCASLPDGFGSGSALGAGDLGCVDTTHVQLATGKPKRVGDVRPLIRPRYFSAGSRH